MTTPKANVLRFDPHRAQWEAWYGSRPVAHSRTLEHLQTHYPDTPVLHGAIVTPIGDGLEGHTWACTCGARDTTGLRYTRKAAGEKADDHWYAEHSTGRR